MRASNPIASSTNTAPGSSTAPKAAHSPPASPPAAPVIGTPRGSRGRRPAWSRNRRVSRRTVSASAPFCGPNTSAARSNGVRTSHRTTRRAPRRPPPRRIASTAPAPPSVVALPPTPTSTTTAPAATAARTSSPVPAVDAVTGSPSPSARRPRPLACAVSTTAVPPSSSSPKPAVSSRPSGSWTGAAAVSPPSAVSSTSIVPSPPSATGHASTGHPAASRPRASAAATSVARSVPLNESGARSTGGRATGGCCQASRVAKGDHVMLEIAGREVRLSNPGKVYFPKPGWSKRDLVDYYLAVADAAVVHLRDRPTVMKRFVNGIEEDPIWQKRVPKSTPDWLQTATVSFPSGRSATELCANDAAHLAWAVNLGVIDFNPWPVRRPELEHPDELRVDLDPTPEASWDDVRQVALVVDQTLREYGLRGYPKTSGSKGMHVNVRVRPEHDFTTVRRAALALAREVERRAPELATSKWWKEERHGVFVDYNQNARDRTVASAYSVRPTPDARVSCALGWDEVADVEP